MRQVDLKSYKYETIHIEETSFFFIESRGLSRWLRLLTALSRAKALAGPYPRLGLSRLPALCRARYSSRAAPYLTLQPKLHGGSTGAQTQEDLLTGSNRIKTYRGIHRQQQCPSSAQARSGPLHIRTNSTNGTCNLSLIHANYTSQGS